MFVAVLVMGYEYHDDYVETGRYSVQCSDEAWTFAKAEAEVEELSLLLGWDDDNGAYYPWRRVESIERVPEPEPVIVPELTSALDLAFRIFTSPSSSAYDPCAGGCVCD